jgi:TolA-binding protein
VDPVPEPTEVRNKTQSVAVSSARAAVPDSSASEAEQQIEALQARVEELERLLARYQGGAAASGKSGAPSAGAAGPVRGARLEVVTPAPSDFRGTPVFLGKDGAQAASDPQRGFSRDEATRAFREAMVLLEAAQPSDAAVAFAEFLARHGDHALAGDAQHALADAYLKQKEFKLAETELKKLIVAYPKSHRVPFALRKLGRVLDTLGKKEEARKQRHLLLTLYPQSPAAAGARIALEEPETLPNAPSEPQLADGAPRTAASDWDEPPPTAPQAGPERSSLPATENDTGGSL